ncbi:MAG: Gx transporter family protein [Eubacteriales bacterium]|nr:Gx transporter family protein [Eubacteriales bacterium]MDD3198769.1 Gx transporter family protein [Eubacteriales bacterium]MDD4121440.1 Gx transporter family protein [Eubacteriales bacterium]MDD4628985.1 Gx transporter family protein [Eubacteriales bacterium]
MDNKLAAKSFINNRNKTQSMVLTALVFASALVIAAVENMLPPLPIAVPGVKFGLSNIAVMFALFFLEKKQAYTIGILKAGFVFITRGAIAGLLSFSGGMLSITAMILLMIIFKEKISYMVLGIFGAVSHNVGQFIVITIIYTGMSIWAYLPILLVSGIIAGIVTSTLLKFIMPAFNRLA